MLISLISELLSRISVNDVEVPLKLAVFASVRVFNSVDNAEDNFEYIVSTNELRSTDEALSSSLIVTVTELFGSMILPSDPEAALIPYTIVSSLSVVESFRTSTLITAVL